MFRAAALAIALMGFGSIAFADCEKEFALNRTLSLLWYPRYEGGISYSHMRLSLNGRVYGLMRGFKDIGSLEGTQRSASVYSRHEFYQFDLELSEREFEQVQEALLSGRRIAWGLLRACVQNGCSILNHKTAFKVIFPFNQVPSWAALYLASARYNPLMRPIHITYHGNIQQKHLRVLADGVLADQIVAWGSLTYLLSQWFSFTH